MAGHSQFKNIMYRKGAQDKKRAKIFTKIIRELTTAARTGLPDPTANPRLRAAIDRGAQAPTCRRTPSIARSSAAPAAMTARITRRCATKATVPGGVAIIVEALTDNRNRTASDVRAAFAKAGGNLGESNSVSFLFDRLGQVTYPAAAASADADVRGGGRGRRRRCRERRRRACRDLRGRCTQRRARRARAPLRRADLGEARVAAQDRDAESTARPPRPCSSSSRRWKTATTCRSVFANFEVADDVMARLSA